MARATSTPPSRTGSRYCGSGCMVSWSGSRSCRTMATITLMVTGQRGSPRVLRRQAGTACCTSSTASCSACSALVTRAYQTGLRTRPGCGGRSMRLLPTGRGGGCWPGAGPSGEPPAGGSGCIYPLLTCSGRAWVFVTAALRRGLLSRRGEPWRSGSAKTIWNWPRRCADMPSGTVAPCRACPGCTCRRSPAGRATASASWRWPWRSWATPWSRAGSCPRCWPARCWPAPYWPATPPGQPGLTWPSCCGGWRTGRGPGRWRWAPGWPARRPAAA